MEAGGDHATCHRRGGIRRAACYADGVAPILHEHPGEPRDGCARTRKPVPCSRARLREERPDVTRASTDRGGPRLTAASRYRTGGDKKMTLPSPLVSWRRLVPVTLPALTLALTLCALPGCALHSANVARDQSPPSRGLPRKDRPVEAGSAQKTPYQVGIASYYGGRFHGRRTANGETFDMHRLTAAHRALSFGTLVEVTNLSNGRSVRVRVNDRGPYVRGRVLDLSYAAAQRIGMVRKGLARVKIEIVTARN